MTTNDKRASTRAGRRAATVYRLGKAVRQPIPRPRAKPGRHSPAEHLLQAQIAVLRALQAYRRWLDTSEIVGGSALSITVVIELRAYVRKLLGAQAQLVKHISESERVRIDQYASVLSEVAWLFYNTAVGGGPDDPQAAERMWAEHAAWAQHHVVPVLRKHFRRVVFV